MNLVVEDRKKRDLNRRGGEGLTLELKVFESLYGGQFELSTKLIKRKSFCYTLH